MIKFNKFYKLFNLLSIIFVTLSVLLLIFKGLNLGVDFKGGTIIELRVTNAQTNISILRKCIPSPGVNELSIIHT